MLFAILFLHLNLFGCFLFACVIFSCHWVHMTGHSNFTCQSELSCLKFIICSLKVFVCNHVFVNVKHLHFFAFSIFLDKSKECHIHLLNNLVLPPLHLDIHNPATLTLAFRNLDMHSLAMVPQVDKFIHNQVSTVIAFK